MIFIKWGYASRGARRHLIGPDGIALCGCVNIVEITDPKNLKHWVACQHCLAKRHLLSWADCCGADCDQASAACYGEIEVVDEMYDEETGNCWWEHACEKHRGDA